MGGVKLVVMVSGGLVQDIISNVSAEVLIIDSDVEGCEEVKRIREWDFKKQIPSEETFEAFDTSPWTPFIEHAATEHYFREMEKESDPKETRPGEAQKGESQSQDSKEAKYVE